MDMATLAAANSYTDSVTGGGGGGGGVSGGVPPGVIVMWSGSAAPNGWALCDGTNGTPDLRGRFVLGATTEVDDDGNTAHPMGETGGSERVILTTDQLPPHTHQVYAGTASGSYGNLHIPSQPVYTGYNGNSYPTNSAGHGASHPNMPPYYVLAYIMKL